MNLLPSFNNTFSNTLINIPYQSQIIIPNKNIPLISKSLLLLKKQLLFNNMRSNKSIHFYINNLYKTNRLTKKEIKLLLKHLINCESKRCKKCTNSYCKILKSLL